MKFFQFMRITVLVCSLQICAACSTQYATVDETQRGKMLSDLKSGNINLTCEDDCLFSFMNEQHKIDKMYAEKLWDDLAVDIFRIGYKSDLSYYYLGLAAERKGYFPAAQQFYNESLRLNMDNVANHHCHQFNVCANNIHEMITKRQAIVAAALSMENDAQQQSNGWQRTPQTVGKKPIAITKKMVLNSFDPDGSGFRNGRYICGEPANSPAYETGRIFKIAYGDLNWDGVQDAAYVMWIARGAGAKRYVIFMITGASGTPQRVQGILLGEHVKVNSLLIRNGQATVQVTNVPGMPRHRVITGHFILRDGAVHPVVNGVVN